MPSPFSNRLHTSSWEWPVAGVALLLGVMISLGWINETNKTERQKFMDPESIRRMNDELINVGQEVSSLREENTKLQNAIAGNSKSSKLLNESLQQSKRFAGLTDVEGPGVTITLRDGENKDQFTLDRIIHDVDVLRVVNELWSAGAEAVEVNGHRIVGTTSIRCVGPVINIDDVRIASPVSIRAIGDTKTLVGGLDIPGGILEELKQQDPNMVRMDEVSKHRFKAYAGNTSFKFLKEPKEGK
jgi:uncharacterized protein YlxW (UPF0749 family)